MSDYNVQGVVRTWDEDKAELERLRSLLVQVRHYIEMVHPAGFEEVVDLLDEALS